MNIARACTIESTNTGLGALALVVVAAGCSRAADVRTKPAEAPIHVDTTVAQDREVPQEVTLTGVLEANERTQLAANATGRVLHVFVELGDRVAPFAPIVQLDARSAALSAREAAANVQNAADQLATYKKDCERYQGLLAKGAITQQEYDRAMGQCDTQTSSAEAARARAAEATQTVTDSTVRAPFAGKIAERFVHVGEYVRPDTKVVTLLADDPLRLRLTVPERDIFAAKEGQKVRFETAGIPGQSFEATLKFIGGEVREQTRDLVVEAVVDNRDGTLLPGMFVSAHLSTGQARLPVIPKKALVAGPTEPSVFVVDGDRVRQRLVQTGAPLGDDVSIADGLKEGDRVVLNPSSALSDGAPVN
jgi:membrane fusion protein, multidrug efflux system